MYNAVFKNILRVAIVESVNYSAQTCKIRMFDRVEGRTHTCSIPQDAIDSGGQGIFYYPEEGAFALIGWGNSERPYIVSFLPNNVLSASEGSLGTTPNISVNSYGYPRLSSGETAIVGGMGSKIHFKKSGTIDISARDHLLSIDPENGFVSKAAAKINSTESSFSYSGIVFRNLIGSTSRIEDLADKLNSFSNFSSYEKIARDPSSAESSLSSDGSSASVRRFRNPAFVEDRKIIREFASLYEVGTIDEECLRVNGADEENFLSQPNKRSNVNYDVLNLNTDNPNSLIESVMGTLVDIYGNILDINRNIIPFDTDTGNNGPDKRIKYLAALTRRSVKIHYELNAKKEASGEVSYKDLSGPDVNNAHVHSRWSFDVDGEGLTKINIPASSNTGNVPLLSRYVNANLIANKKDIDITNKELQVLKNTDKPDFKPSKDIYHLGFGDFRSDGINIPDSYSPLNLAEEGKIKYRSAYHDVVNTAKFAMQGLQGSRARSGARETPGGFYKALSENLVNTILSDGTSAPNCNAGGRSLFANLDGSIELNIGRDFIDHKSIMIDTSGGIVSRIGKMSDSSKSASIISQLDGSVFIQVGGDVIEKGGAPAAREAKLENPRVRLVVVGSKGNDEIIIDEKYVKIKSTGKSIILESSKDIILNAKRNILLMGSSIHAHGEVDIDGNITKGPERLIASTGKVI